MARLTDTLLRAALGSTDVKHEGRQRTLRGLRENDNRQLYIGLALTALHYFRRTRPRRELIYRTEVREGAALVIHHRSSGQSRLEIVKPGKG
jgi:hypothetical protein